MAKVKVNTTLAGSYGIAHAGDTIEVSTDAAKAIVDAGNGTLVSEPQEVKNEAKYEQTKEKPTVTITQEKKSNAGPSAAKKK